MQRGVQRSLFHMQHVRGCRAQVLNDVVAVHRAARQRLEDEEIERALEQVVATGRTDCHGWRSAPIKYLWERRVSRALERERLSLTASCPSTWRSRGPRAARRRQRSPPAATHSAP